MKIFNFFEDIYLPSALASTMRGFNPRIFDLIQAINSITSHYISCSEARGIHYTWKRLIFECFNSTRIDCLCVCVCAFFISLM